MSGVAWESISFRKSVKYYKIEPVSIILIHPHVVHCIAQSEQLQGLLSNFYCRSQNHLIHVLCMANKIEAINKLIYF